MVEGFASCVTRVVVLSATLALGGAVVAQADPPDPPSTVPEVTIEAQRQALEGKVQSFVRKITASTRFQGESLARWREPLCFVIAGLPKPKAEFVLSRLSQVATSVGARVRDRGCSQERQGNFYVIFSADPALTLKYLNWHPGLLFGKDANVAQIDGFLKPSSPKAVRVWHNADLFGNSGSPVGVDTGCGGASLPGMQSNCGFDGGSRVQLAAVLGLSEAVIVFDSNRIGGLHLGQLADFAAMAGLVELDLDADLAQDPTILRLFTEPEAARPQGLTAWDQAFLNASYHIDQAVYNQRAQIAASVVHDVAK